MVDFGRPYYTPMDQQYHSETKQIDRRTNIEEPIFPIHAIGMTVPEQDLTGRVRNIVEGVEAAFRTGVGNIQLVMQGIGQTGGMGPAAGPKGYGEEVREAIREIQKASGGKITGVELPTQINSLSGFSQQGFSEEQRKLSLDEVRDAIKFVGDIAGGGGVDIVAFEFPRDYSDASWFKGKNDPFKQREEPKAMLVDKETGRVSVIDKRDKFYLYYDPKTHKEVEEPQQFTWNQLSEIAKEKGVTPDRFLTEQQFETQLKKLKGERGYYSQLLYQTEQEKEELERAKKENPEQFEKNKLAKHLADVTYRREGYEEALKAMKIQEKEVEKSRDRFVPVKDFAVEKAAQSYAQAGIWAMQESEKNQFVQRGKGSIHVGPEMGWPTYYGSHPQEFVELIRRSREEMSRKLVQEEKISKHEADSLAKQHIKGELDTSHMGMWLQTFKPELPWDQRVSEFKKWYKGEIEKLAEVNKKEDIIGGIQVVDSASGAHGHLPPGQGVLGKDLLEYMKILKEKGGYKGELTSEGHEEEKFGQGRILTKAWESFRAPISSSYLFNRPAPQFSDIRASYAQYGYGTTGIFQSYVPSNDFTLWSNVPLE